MKTRHLLFSLVLSISSTFLIVDTSNAIAAEHLNSVVAVVNNGVITQSDLDTAYAQAKQELVASKAPNAPSDAQLRSMVLQQLIDRKLQLELADNAHITVSDAQVMQTITKIAAQNHLTLDELKQKLKERNLSYDAYKKNITEQLRMQQVQEGAVGSQIHVTPADIQQAQKEFQSQINTQQQYHLIDIRVPTKMQAQRIASQLKGGKDIASYSNYSKDLGWQTENTLPTVFVDALKQMSAGDVAGPIHAPNGFHVIKLVGSRGNQTNAPTQAQLKNVAYQMKMQKAVQKWLATIRKTAYIKITAP